MGLVTLTFDLLTLKLVCESNLRCGTFTPTDSQVIRYVRDGQTDGQTVGRTKATLIAPSLRTGV